MWYHMWQMTKTTLYLETEMTFSVRQCANTEGRSQADVIRAAISAYTRDRVRQPIPGAGKFRSGTQDTAENAKQILKEASKAGKWRHAPASSL